MTAALPTSLAANPKLSSWVRFTADGTVAISPGKVEIGQGIVTALAQIAADELDIDIARVRMLRASTAASPNEGVTSGRSFSPPRRIASAWTSAISTLRTV